MVSILAQEQSGQYATHDVTNQPPPLAPYDAAQDTALLEGLRREGAGWAEEDVRRLGLRAGSVQAQEWGEQANRHEPELRTHDRYGHRVDEVEFHPSWHHLMRVAVGEGLAAAPWADEQPGAHVARTMRRNGVGAHRGRARLPDVDDVRGRPRAVCGSPSSRRSTNRC